MTKNDIVKVVNESVSLELNDIDSKIVKKVVAETIDTLALTVERILSESKDEKIPFGKIGFFKVKHVNARDGITQLGENKGQKWHKDAHDEITFSVSKGMKNI